MRPWYRPSMHVTLAVSVAALTARFCSAFLALGCTVGSAKTMHGTCCLAASQHGPHCASQGRCGLVDMINRRSTVGELRMAAGGAEVTDKDAVVAKFKKLQVHLRGMHDNIERSRVVDTKNT